MQASSTSLVTSSSRRPSGPWMSASSTTGTMFSGTVAPKKTPRWSSKFHYWIIMAAYGERNRKAFARDAANRRHNWWLFLLLQMCGTHQQQKMLSGGEEGGGGTQHYSSTSGMHYPNRTRSFSNSSLTMIVMAGAKFFKKNNAKK